MCIRDRVGADRREGTEAGTSSGTPEPDGCAQHARPGDVTRRGEDPADQQGRIDCTQTAAVAQQRIESVAHGFQHREAGSRGHSDDDPTLRGARIGDSQDLSLIHISEPTRLLSISYAVFCLKKKNITIHT